MTLSLVLLRPVVVPAFRVDLPVLGFFEILSLLEVHCLSAAFRHLRTVILYGGELKDIYCSCSALLDTLHFSDCRLLFALLPVVLSWSTVRPVDHSGRHTDPNVPIA